MVNHKLNYIMLNCWLKWIHKYYIKFGNIIGRNNKFGNIIGRNIKLETLLEETFLEETLSEEKILEETSIYTQQAIINNYN